MGCFGSKQKLTKEDLEFLKSHTRYDEATIKEWYKGFRVRSSHFCLCPPVEQLSFSLNSYSSGCVPSLSFTRRIFCCQSAPPVHPHGQVFWAPRVCAARGGREGRGRQKLSRLSSLHSCVTRPETNTAPLVAAVSLICTRIVASFFCWLPPLRLGSKRLK